MNYAKKFLTICCFYACTAGICTAQTASAPEPELSLPDAPDTVTKTDIVPETPPETLTTETAAPDDIQNTIPAAEPSGFDGITAQARGNSIIITWEETGALPLEYAVLYRSSEPITESSILTADLLARIPAGKKLYTDKTAGTGQYYYALMPENHTGAVTFVYTPLANTTAEAVSKQLTVMTPAEITALDAQAKDNTVVIRYAATQPGNTLILYRSTSPLVEQNNLAGAVIVSVFTDKGVPVIDYPVQGIPCYYGLIDEENVRTGTAVFTAGVNATTVPVYTNGTSVRKKNDAVVLRSIPLPYLALPGVTMPPAKHLDAETERLISTLISTIQKKEYPQPDRNPYVFDEETNTKTTGEASMLMNIIRGSFAKKQWSTAADDIKHFLELHRSESVTARARFYLGETYFFSGMYREALTEFLFSRSLYYAQSQEWIQYTLNKLDAVP